MSEDWRRKSYYDPRVTIETDRVLTPQFADSVLCLTGAQLEMLRNLTAYLKRRSTFVSEYHDGYYLAPTNEQWDALQAIVADLEDTIMGCEEFTDLLTAVLACVCETATQAEENNWIGPGTPPAIDSYLDTGGLQLEDNYGSTIPIDADRCAIAQLTYWNAYDLMTEHTGPISLRLVDVVLPAAMAALALAIGTGGLGIPVGIIIVVLTLLIRVAVDGAQENLTNEYVAYQEELICALYDGLATDYRTAETNAVAVIAEMNIGPTDKVLLHTMMAPWAMQLAKKAYDNETAWSLAHLVEDYCAVCAIVDEMTYEFPPCPGEFTGTYMCWEGRLSLNSSTICYSPVSMIETGLKNGIFQCWWVGVENPGITRGYLRLEGANAPEGPWNSIKTLNCTTNAPPYEQSYSFTSLDGLTFAYPYLHVRCWASGSGSNPSGFNVDVIHWQIEDA